jgi:hypothetical protein
MVIGRSWLDGYPKKEWKNVGFKKKIHNSDFNYQMHKIKKKQKTKDISSKKQNTLRNNWILNYNYCVVCKC